MEWLKSLEHSLGYLVKMAKFSLEFVFVSCVILGFFKTLQLIVTLIPHSRQGYTTFFNQIRLRFGLWLALALEFQLGADILSTTIAPTWKELANLALIATIRTFLNFFLGKELEVELELEKNAVNYPEKCFSRLCY